MTARSTAGVSTPGAITCTDPMHCVASYLWVLSVRIFVLLRASFIRRPDDGCPIKIKVNSTQANEITFARLGFIIVIVCSYFISVYFKLFVTVNTPLISVCGNTDRGVVSPQNTPVKHHQRKFYSNNYFKCTLNPVLISSPFEYIGCEAIFSSLAPVPIPPISMK
jgi:hypothetical protein